MGSSPSINIPPQASYSEAMADSLEAQYRALTGTGEFAKIAADAGIGPGEGFMQGLLERYEAPLRKTTAQIETDTLRQTILGTGSDEKYAPDGRIIVGYEDPPATGAGGAGSSGYKIISEFRPSIRGDTYGLGIPKGDSDLHLVDLSTGKKVSTITTPNLIDSFGDTPLGKKRTAERTAAHYQKAYDQFVKEGFLTPQQVEMHKNADFKDALVFGDASQGGGVTEATPIYKKDSAGNDIVADPGTFTPGGSVGRAEDGMIDLLGDSRELVGQGRRAGFDEDENFLGLAAFTEDLGYEQQSRRRERDLADVERLSGRYKDVMDQFKDEGLMTEVGEVGGSQDVFLRDITGQTGAAGPTGATGPAGVASAGVNRRSGTTAQPGMQSPGLRQGLISEAQTALNQGLTDREERQIAEAARARATMMGRTFDQSEAIKEAEARVAEDNQRRMQNRAFAQSVLGQETDTRLRQMAMDRERNLDPFQAILGRSGGSTVGEARNLLGTAGYGLDSRPNYLNPQAGINYASQRYANQAGLEAARMSADARRQAGLYNMFGDVAGSLIGLKEPF